MSKRTKLGRELVEFAALFFAVGTADLFANTLAHHGPMVLFGLGVLLIIAAVIHRWHTHRRPKQHIMPPGEQTEPRVWRVRTTLRDTPGSLAALAASLSAHHINIASIQVCPVPDGAVDELMVEAPSDATPEQLHAAVQAGGGSHVHAEPADRHDLIDLPTQVLAVAGQSLTHSTSLPEALQALFGCTVVPAARGHREGIHETTMRVRDPQGEMLTLERPEFFFTPAEWARARALISLHRDVNDENPSVNPAMD